ncbi:Vesicle transport through interaction with t-SNAREs 1A [Portunus trituberculatus]|uniref:Vesicle transport through interaction with t-SNAREs 1A n=1 Tax=Portunus trituberculatus TaxID=210409 RepID=A0A5B7DF31_PORTR|nr:Vesicle transport through interaction with t-SNAREs 1A [Portunus trituberculatus]
MATLMTEFQQQFATVTADITHKICQIATREEHSNGVCRLNKLERMELEVRDAEPAVRERLRAHIRGYQVELRRLEAECSRVRASPTAPGSSAREELLGGGGGGISAGLSAGEEQRQALLDNTETLERTSTRLVQGHKVALETEHIGAQILNDLHSQRQTLSHARQRGTTSSSLFHIYIVSHPSVSPSPARLISVSSGHRKVEMQKQAGSSRVHQRKGRMIESTG